MLKLGFYIGGVSAAVPFASKSDIFAHVVVAVTSSQGLTPLSVGEVKQGGDSAFGMLKNKWLNYGWMSCNTQVNGHEVSTDAEGRTMPQHLDGKHIEIEVDAGTAFSGFSRVATQFKVTEMDQTGNKGSVLFEFDGLMRIWAGRLSSDAGVAGQFKPITGDSRLAVARQVLHCEAREH